MIRAALIASLLTAAVAAGFAFGRSSAPSRARPVPVCGTACSSAYRAIAATLPHDSSNTLARNILAADGFDYARLSRALHVPSGAQLRRQWRRRCRATFPADPERVSACYRLILSSTYRYLDEPRS
jgi:uncharacterized membrane protein